MCEISACEERVDSVTTYYNTTHDLCSLDGSLQCSPSANNRRKGYIHTTVLIPIYIQCLVVALRFLFISLGILAASI